MTQATAAKLQLNAAPMTLQHGDQAIFDAPDAYVILTAQNLTTGTALTQLIAQGLVLIVTECG